MVTPKKERQLLKLTTNNCESFEATITIAEEDFLRDAFIEAIPKGEIADTFAQRNVLFAFCGRHSKQIDYWAEVHVHGGEENSESPKLIFHVSLSPTKAPLRKAEPPPYAEEIFQWLRQFITDSADVFLEEVASFSFPRSQYRSVFSLPSILSGPLNYTENEVFEGAQLAGVMIFPKSNSVGVYLAGHSALKNEIAIKLGRKAETNAQKLLSIESDVVVLRSVALSTVRPIRKAK